METPSALLKFLAKASLNAVGGGVAGEIVLELMPGVFRDVWGWWSKDRTDEQRRAELEALAQSPSADVKTVAKQATTEAAGDRSPEVQAVVETYLTMVPSSLRRSLRRQEDPRGVSLPRGLSLQKAEDLARLLPQRPPRFFPGQRPLPGVDWQVIKLLGAGGFGEVWLARNPRFQNMPQVALKFCLDPSAKQVLLQHEAAVLDQVMSQAGGIPGVVKLRQTYLSAEPPCLEYEYVAGGDLADILYGHRQGAGGLAPELAIKILRKLSQTMGQAHHLEPPIVHRDLKPANILVERRTEGKVGFRIADFGIGGVAADRAIEQTRRSSGPMLLSSLHGSHTPLYASPQQIKGEPPDPRDDVHALGVIWYQLLVGDLSRGAPHGRGWKVDLTQRGVNQATIDLLEECFEEDAAHRIADAGLLSERIEALLKPEVVVPPPPQQNPLGEKQEVVAPPNDLGQPSKDSPSPEGVGLPDSVPPVGPTAEVTTDPLGAGIACLERGEFVQAIRAFTRMIRATPRAAEPYRYRARAYLRRGKSAKAFADLDQVVKLEPKVAGNFLERGKAYLEYGTHDKAISDFSQAILHGDRSATSYLARGRCYSARGVFDLAFADFDSALRADPQLAEVYYHRGETRLKRGELEQAEADLDEAIRHRPDNARYLNAQGRMLLAQGKVDKALASFIQAEQRDPHCVETYINRAQIWINKGLLDQAVTDLDRAIRFETTSGTALAARARVRVLLGQHGRALSDFNKAIKCQPRDATLRLERGRVHLAKNDPQSAAEDFQAAIKLDPGCSEAFLARGKAHLELRKFGRAIADFTRVLEHDVACTFAYVGRAWAHLGKGQCDLAQADANEAIRLGESVAIALRVRGCAHLDRKAFDLALTDFTESLRLDPACAATYNDRGRVNYLLGEHARAVSDFSLAIKLAAKNPEYYLNRGKAHAKNGDRERAQADREKAASLTALRTTKVAEVSVTHLAVSTTSGSEALPNTITDCSLPSMQQAIPGDGVHDDPSRAYYDVSLANLLGAGLLEVGDKVFMRWGPRGGAKRVFEGTITSNGEVEVLGKAFTSLSFAALHAMKTEGSTRTTENGWVRWKTAEGVLLANLRDQYLEGHNHPS